MRSSPSATRSSARTRARTGGRGSSCCAPRCERTRAWSWRTGGVDSSVLLAVAHEQLGRNALGVIGVSDSYATRELELALAQAARIGARVETVTTGELADPVFASNPSDRCYHCKRELYAQLSRMAAREAGSVITDGTITDDLADYRPGRRAAAEGQVRSPLAELGFSKADVRAVADALGPGERRKARVTLPRQPHPVRHADHARQPVPGGERGEALLRALGFDELRVRRTTRRNGPYRGPDGPAGPLHGARRTRTGRLRPQGARFPLDRAGPRRA